MGKFIDLTGQRFGKLLVISRDMTPHKSKDTRWRCICDCGNHSSPRAADLKDKKAVTCGCGRLEKVIKHKLSHSATYKSWGAMLGRCLNPNNTTYKLYGGAGIVVCDRWNTGNGGSFLNFLEDMGERPEGKTLNRTHGNKVYSKETCEWATLSIQAFDQKLSSNNTSGVTGVNWKSNQNTWRAMITFQGEQIHLGHTKTFEEAVQLREDAEIKYFGFLLKETRCD